jgi:archaellum component FlaF (FlaF/FlaG flagellin family)
MQQAQKSYQQKLAKDIEDRENIVIDGTAASFNKTKQFKHLIPSWDYQFPGVHTVKIKTITPAGKEKVYSSYLPTFDGNGFLLKGLT